MKRKRLFWQLFPSFVSVTLAALLITATVACLAFRSFYYEDTARNLEARLQLVKKRYVDLILLNEFKEIDKTCRTLGKDSETRLTVVLPSGKVIGDTKENPTKMDNHADRPEIKQVFQGNKGKSIRYSYTLDEELMYLAVPLESEGKIIGVARASVSLLAVRKSLWSLYIKILAGCVMVLGIVALVSWWLARRISRPIEAMRLQAERIAKGDFSGRVRLSPTDPLELDGLARAMDDIAVQTNERIGTILNQKNEQEAVFSSMAEGVVALDNHLQIRYLNHSAAKILRVSAEQVVGLSVQEAIRIPELQELVSHSLNREEPSGGDIVIFNGSEISIRVYISPLWGVQKKKTGLVLVLTDITQLKRLEKHRQEFVANVSHELRTPLTSIQGFAETLLNPSVTDPKEIKEFLNIIHLHGARLGAIVEDLLSLSKLEREAERKEIPLSEERVRPVLEAAIRLCRVKAEKSKVQMELDCEEDLKAKLNAPLLEQAVVNLLDNAIKYSDEGSRVKVVSRRAGREVVVTVDDNGPGIPKQHHARLFERFYRVDKARSRRLGGTGLGLSIVKHIALAHEGRVEVESMPGKGSRFSLYLAGA